jgi:chromosomal replication initiation ATPase DnaA
MTRQYAKPFRLVDIGTYTRDRDRARDIFERVAARFGFTFADLRSHNIARAVVEARRIACYLVRRITGLGFVTIGPLLERSGATISHACRVVARKLRKWPGGSTALAIAQAEGALT